MESIKETSEWSAAIHALCPRCRTGAMFTGSAYGFKIQKMNESCPHCKLKFEREPGYFYVAMFISYAMNVAELIAACVGTYLLTGNLESPWLYLGATLVTAFLLSPLNYRYSRVILLFWLTPGLRYTPTINGRHKEQALNNRA
ncbi:DUF983 domain-containing protein [Olivibacter sp. XZL3]|uniref:DUF983 domain-containing protein n=1 Tax=Olivibacter sp. XZL3 TaxID=1735116 RepID=UPI001981C20A|nr:DUF983 domain-containing protein [Olivibacter sp. XZL3]